MSAFIDSRGLTPLILMHGQSEATDVLDLRLCENGFSARRAITLWGQTRRALFGPGLLLEISPTALRICCLKVACLSTRCTLFGTAS